MALLLRTAGFEPQEAGSVAEGLALANGQGVALVDLNLPDGEGTAVLRHLREHHPHMRVAIVSAQSTHDYFPGLKESGVRPDAVFQKPVDPEALVEWITDVG